MEDAVDDTASPVLCLSTDFEPYGTVPPWNSRLLKVLPNGFPMYEPTTLPAWEDNETLPHETKPSTNDQELEEVNTALLKIERRMKGITGSLDMLRSTVEKYFIVVDCEARTDQKKRDPLFRNRDKWIACEMKKGEALRELVNLQDLFRLVGLSASSIPEQRASPSLAFRPSITPNTSEAQYAALAVGISKRWQLYLPLLQAAEQTLHQIKVSVLQQKRFLRIVNEIKRIWNVQKVPYAPHVYEKELFNPPSNCWGYDRPRRWILPGHFGTASEPLGQPTPAPFLCWPPLPAVPPTAPATAEVFFTTAGHDEDTKGTQPLEGKGAETLGIQIRWIGDASHNIETKNLLSVRIIPVAIRTHGVRQQAFEEIMSTKACSAQRPTSVRLPPLLPEPVGSQPEWSPETKRLHRRLQAAQWHLVDRAVHLLYQAQAARLKSVLDAVAYGTTDSAATASAILEEFESLSDKLPVYLPFGDSHAVTVERRVTVERWETYSTAISIQDLPVYSKAATDNHEPVFTMDVEVWVNYESSTTSQPDNASMIPLPADATPFERQCIIEFNQRLCIAESLAVCFLRHEFLRAWQSTVRDVPREALDLYDVTLVSTRQARGGKIFVNFLNWIQTYLVARMLHRQQ